MIGYCVKCKQQREINNLKETKTSKGVKMVKGNCSICSTKMCRLIGGK